jgi:chromosome segregation ATPase
LVESLHSREVKSHEIAAALGSELDHLSALAQESNLLDDTPDSLAATLRDDFSRIQAEIAHFAAELTAVVSEVDEVKSATSAFEAEKAATVDMQSNIAHDMSKVSAALGAVSSACESLDAEVVARYAER